MGNTPQHKGLSWETQHSAKIREENSREKRWFGGDAVEIVGL